MLGARSAADRAPAKLSPREQSASRGNRDCGGSFGYHATRVHRVVRARSRSNPRSRGGFRCLQALCSSSHSRCAVSRPDADAVLGGDHPGCTPASGGSRAGTSLVRGALPRDAEATPHRRAGGASGLYRQDRSGTGYRFDDGRPRMGQRGVWLRSDRTIAGPLLGLNAKPSNFRHSYI
jgi:hypothetical protein